jgi:hypothetical protein
MSDEPSNPDPTDAGDEPTEAGTTAGAPTDGASAPDAAAEDGRHQDLVSEDPTLGTVKDVTISLLGPAAATQTAAAASSGGQSCDAYPAEALKTALEMPIDPQVLWKIKDGPGLHEARSLNKRAAEARIALLEKSAWATAPEMVLLDESGETGSADRKALAKKMLEIRAGMTEADGKRRVAEAELVEQRAGIAAVMKETFAEARDQMKLWREFAWVGILLLLAATVFAAIEIVHVINLASDKKIDGTLAPIIIFILAIFAISPAVLLILGRPLKGLDEFTPAGPTSGEAGSGSTAAATGTDGASTAGSTTAGS